MIKDGIHVAPAHLKGGTYSVRFDKDYIKMIDLLIPTAAGIARTKEVSDLKTKGERQEQGKDNRDFTWSYFSEHFHAAMTKLCADHGIRQPA